MTYEERRKEILAYLKQRFDSASGLDDQRLDGVEQIAARWQSGNQHTVGFGLVEVYAVLWGLVREGILIPGHRTSGRTGNGNEWYRSFPYYSITEYGARVLRNLDIDYEPTDIAGFIERLKLRVPNLNEIATRYAAEAVGTFNSEHYLASAILIGVAAESTLDDVYDAFARHLGSREDDFTAKMGGKRWASPRFEYAMKRLEPHRIELEKGLLDRLDSQLGYLSQIIKVARDDVGHARPARIDRELARLNLIAFPVLAGLASDLIVALASPCSL